MCRSSAPSAGLPSAAVPQAFTTVDDSYFDDALFIGDSRIDDMHSFSGLNNATYFAKTGMSVYKLFKDPWVTLDGVQGELTLEEALSRGTYGKIYLMVGVNDFGTGDEARFIKKYAETVDRIRALHEALPAHLVLHGGSGVPDEQIQAAVHAGIRKINFGTDVCCALLDGIRAADPGIVAVDLFMREPTRRVRDFAVSKIRLLGAGA